MFADGISSGSIVLSVASDDVPELDELTRVTLTNVVENGVPPSGDSSRGASIVGGLDEAVLTVQANDDPHGVVGWATANVTAQEEEGSNAVLQLSLIREFGDIGAIVISYSTVIDAFAPAAQQAQSLQDFIPASGEVVMGNGQTSVTISVTILQVSYHNFTQTELTYLTFLFFAGQHSRSR